MPEPQVPPEWNTLDLKGKSGIWMVVGSPDTGKSTLARYLFMRTCEEGKPVAFLDGDPGQSVLGPPTTLTLSVSRPGEVAYPPQGEVWRRFAGSVTPSRHMLPVLVGAKRLVQQAMQAGTETIIYDTSGLVDAMQGGLALKLAKFELLEPRLVFGIQYENELEPLLAPLRRSRRVEVVALRPADAVTRRESPVRQRYRAERFAHYFQNAAPVCVDWGRIAVFPAPRFALNRLVSFDDSAGFCLGLGIIVEIDRQRRELQLLAPPVNLDSVRSITLGDVLVDPHNFHDRRID